MEQLRSIHIYVCFASSAERVLSAIYYVQLYSAAAQHC